MLYRCCLIKSQENILRRFIPHSSSFLSPQLKGYKLEQRALTLSRLSIRPPVMHVLSPSAALLSREDVGQVCLLGPLAPLSALRLLEKTLQPSEAWSVCSAILFFTVSSI